MNTPKATNKLKMIFRLLLIVISIGFYTTSCQKELSLDNVLTPPPVSDDSTLLVKLIEIDSISALEKDSLVAQNTFDANNRLVTSTVFGTTDPVAQALNYNKQSYFYLNADSLPDLIVHEYTETGGAEMDIDSTFIAYDAAGKLLWDSTIYTVNTLFSYNEKRSYAYSGDTVKITSNRDGVFYEANQLVIKIQNGNIVKAEVEDFVTEYVYDNKPNAFMSLANFPFQFASVTVGGFLYLTQKNNCISQKTKIGGALLASATITYTYRNNGLPSSRLVKSENTLPSPNVSYLRSAFYYDKKR
jgi:hypothetical protein